MISYGSPGKVRYAFWYSLLQYIKSSHLNILKFIFNFSNSSIHSFRVNFDKSIYLYNHLHNPDKKIDLPFSPHKNKTTKNFILSKTNLLCTLNTWQLQLYPHPYNFAFSRMSWKWNHAICRVLSVFFFFTKNNAFEIHPCCWVYQQFLLLLLLSNKNVLCFPESKTLPDNQL